MRIRPSQSQSEEFGPRPTPCSQVLQKGVLEYHCPRIHQRRESAPPRPPVGVHGTPIMELFNRFFAGACPHQWYVRPCTCIVYAERDSSPVHMVRWYAVTCCVATRQACARRVLRLCKRMAVIRARVAVHVPWYKVHSSANTRAHTRAAGVLAIPATLETTRDLCARVRGVATGRWPHLQHQSCAYDDLHSQQDGPLQ